MKHQGDKESETDGGRFTMTGEDPEAGSKRSPSHQNPGSKDAKQFFQGGKRAQTGKGAGTIAAGQRCTRLEKRDNR